MVEFTPAFICRCKIVQNKIVFSTLHKQAEMLLAVCDYLQKFIRNVKLDDHQVKAVTFNPPNFMLRNGRGSR
jgi:hypothetical protein